MSNQHEENTFDKIKNEYLSENKTFSAIPAQLLVNCAKEEGQKLTEEGAKNNQIRKFYDTVKAIERKAKDGSSLDDKIKAQLIFLKPHLANARKKAKGLGNLLNILDTCLNLNYFKEKEDLTRFVKFFESIVAYHR